MSASDRARFPEQTLFLVPGGAGISSMRQRYERWLQILMVVTGFVLLLVCANVAGLMLVRGMDRRRQTSLSLALGAGPSRIIRQDLTESVVLSLLGGAAGLAVAFAATRLILYFAFPSNNGMPAVPIDASPSLAVLLFAFAVSMLAGIAFGIAPGWVATRIDPIEALRGASRVTAATGSLPRRALVVLQIALSLALLSASGLLTSALYALQNQDFGFAQDRRMVAQMNLRLAGYQAAQLPQLYRRIHDAIAGIPGVSSVALCLYSPPGAEWGSPVWVGGRPPASLKEQNVSLWDRVTPDFFNAIGTPIIKGRGISEQDSAASQRVAVVNEAFVRKFFRNEDPVGKHFGRAVENSGEFEIIGVAKDARFVPNSLEQPVLPILFLPEAQADYSKSAGSLFLRDIVIAASPGAMLSRAELRRAIASVDPEIPLMSVQTLKEKVDLQFTQQRLIARLTSMFGMLSLILASLGLYGVVAYNARRRMTEVGLRMALGASRGDVVRLVLRGAVALIGIGLLIGLPLSLAAARLLRSQLDGVNPSNPAALLIAIASLTAAALLASIIPALRASSISPLDVLRTD
jgi:predicted permease